MGKKTFKERSEIAVACLPESPYRDTLAKLLEELNSAKDSLLAENVQAAEKITAMSAENERIRTKLMESMHYGADEKLWPPGVDYLDAACKAIEGGVTLDDVPQTAEEVRAFVGVHMCGLKFGADGGDPDDNDTYALTAHDLASAFRDWFDLD